MRWISIVFYCTSAALLLFVLLAFSVFGQTKSISDRYGNHASVVGLVVSVVGFALTLWTVYETLRLNARAQEMIKRHVDQAHQDTRNLLSSIRVQAMEDTCNQAYFFATEARNAVRGASWLRAAERCQDARQLAVRLLTYRDLTDPERTSIRGVVEDLKTAVSFIERNRLKRNAPTGMPPDKVAPLDRLIDDLQQIRSRLQQQLLEIPDVNIPAN